MSGRRAWAPRRIDEPKPGFYRMSLVRGGWKVPCQIQLNEQTGRWTSVVDGVERTAIDPGDTDVFRIWLAAEEIEAWRYADLMAWKVWAAEHAPSHPCLHARQRIDPMRLKLVDVPASLLRAISGEKR